MGIVKTKSHNDVFVAEPKYANMVYSVISSHLAPGFAGHSTIATNCYEADSKSDLSSVDKSAFGGATPTITSGACSSPYIYKKAPPKVYEHGKFETPSVPYTIYSNSKFSFGP